MLHPEAHPPSWYSVAMIAAMPNLQRERAGFTERLGHYLAQPAPKKAFVIQVGKRTSSRSTCCWATRSRPTPRACRRTFRWRCTTSSCMARMGALPVGTGGHQGAGPAGQGVRREGVWQPEEPAIAAQGGSTRSPTTTTRCDLDPKTTEGREVDVTFRLALIAKLWAGARLRLSRGGLRD